MSTITLGQTPSSVDQYSKPEKEIWNNGCQQVDEAFPNNQNLVINMTWFDS